MIIEYKDYGRYNGEVNKDGNPHGQGRLEFEYGGYYVGEWKNGEMHGYGIMVYDEDEYYEGYFVNSEMHGHGKNASPLWAYRRGRVGRGLY